MVIDQCIESVFFGGVEDRSGCEASGYTRGEAIYLNVATMLQLGGRISEPSYPGNVVRESSVCLYFQLYDLSTGGLFPGSVDGCPLENAACGSESCGRGQCQVTDVVAGKLKAACVCDHSWRKSNSDKCDTSEKVRYLNAH
ncbi:HMR1-like protein [Mya arenaria]|uniref:HMR1-like protein n=1 Tax=Mya arenaria TaxID=6604 RepID=A0ABY7DYF3_MYAAR|nr:HMR1-like protein [Mya arenaria]